MDTLGILNWEVDLSEIVDVLALEGDMIMSCELNMKQLPVSVQTCIRQANEES